VFNQQVGSTFTRNYRQGRGFRASISEKRKIGFQSELSILRNKQYVWTRLLRPKNDDRGGAAR
jgi:hypothetical protein